MCLFFFVNFKNILHSQQRNLASKSSKSSVLNLRMLKNILKLMYIWVWR